MVIKGKNEQLLIKQLKTCEKKMQELTNSIKRANLRIMGIEEGEEVQVKGIRNIFIKIITENFPNLENDISIQMQKASRAPKRPDQNRNTLSYIINETSSEARKRILKGVREKKQVRYNGMSIKITADFPIETLKARRGWGENFQALNENNFNPRILYWAKLSFKTDGVANSSMISRNQNNT
jgi:hypothetical protein